MTDTPETLSALFGALQAERERTWDADKLARNAEQRRALVDAFDPAKVVKAGDTVAPFTIEPAEGGTATLDALLADGPVALVFFRFAGCPACNIALPYYDRQLRPALDRLGVRLVGVSAHLPEKGLGAIAERHGLGFAVAADRDYTLARRFGLTFQPLDTPPAPEGEEWIGSLTGTGTWEWSQAAVVLIDTDHTVAFADISPDWLIRTEAPAVIAAAEALRVKAAA